MIAQSPWSTAEVTAAVAMRNEGSTPDAIGAALGRSAAAVSLRLHRARASGVAVASDRRLTRWTPERTERAMALWAAKAPAAAIAAELGVTKKALQALLGRVRARCPWIRGCRTPVRAVRRPPHLAWTDEQRRELQDGHRGGAPIAVLAARLGRSVPAVAGQIAFLRGKGVDLPRWKKPRPP